VAPHQQDAEQPPTITVTTNNEEDSIDIDIKLENTELPPTVEEVMEILDEDEEIWGREPIVRIVPSSKPTPRTNVIVENPSQPSTTLGTLTGDQRVAESDPTTVNSGPTGPTHTQANIEPLGREVRGSRVDRVVTRSQTGSIPTVRYF
jgi:hypothetical protein